MRSKIRGSHLTCKVTNKSLNVHEQAKVVERNPKMILSLLCSTVNRQCLWERKPWCKKVIIRISLNSSKRKILCYTSRYGNGNLINLSRIQRITTKYTVHLTGVSPDVLASLNTYISCSVCFASYAMSCYDKILSY